MIEARVRPEISPPTGGVLALLRSGAALSVAVAATYGLNGLFNLMMVRALEPRQYSLMAALFTIVLVSNVPTLALQAGVARGMAQGLRDGGEAAAGAVLRRALGAMLRWQAVLFGVAAATAYPLVHLLHVRHVVPLAATAAAIAIGALIPVAYGGMQAHQRFDDLSLVQFVNAALKFPACLGLLALGFGVSGVMVGIALATALTVCVALWLLRDTVRAARLHAQAPATALVRDSTLAAISFTVWAIAANLDLLVARLALPAHRAGLYAAASTAAKLVFAVAGVATTVLFPRVAGLADRRLEREHLVLGVRFVTVFATAGTVLAFAFPHEIVNATLGAKYAVAAPWLGWIAVAMSLFAIANVYLAHFMALGNSRFPLVLGAGLALEVIVFAAMHSSVHQLLIAELLAGGGVVVCAELYDRLRAG
jgi:O-antigen/teichoic acid export membrane protein